MSAYIVCDQSSKPVSIGTLNPESLPAGHTKVTITDADFDAVRRGDKRVLDGGVLEDTGRAALDANRVTNEDGMRASLVEMKAVLDDAAATAKEKRVARAVRRLLKAQLNDFATPD